ncbi:E1-E2 ATPase-domain-containing protein [Blyttiomyces helicus]|uniref:E1-E2 ATPase-domain-containing protein n=1 Tax=Blyttiomyces helicus TaxID=388810 RepID=A0A4P9WKH8_9FUNG|nr:E1-E2 ATPase-domain-containing protein [Blyttiomyces helicus]|eukprot:RKO92078.1 E1-E2 ATPase-domain-containing protein [Blyttiomyces helicus]
MADNSSPDASPQHNLQPATPPSRARPVQPPASLTSPACTALAGLPDRNTWNLLRSPPDCSVSPAIYHCFTMLPERSRGLLLLLLGAAFNSAEAKPLWNTVNGVDLNGNTCPAIIRLNVPCPVVCVTDLKSCPAAVAPSCPAGQVWCQDGACHPSTCPAGLTSLCSCPTGWDPSVLSNPATTSSTLLPCLGNFSTSVPDYDEDDVLGQQPLYKACASKLGSANVSGKSVQLNCAPKSVTPLSYTATEFVVFYGFWGGEAFLLLMFLFYKMAVESVGHGKITNHALLTLFYKTDHPRSMVQRSREFLEKREGRPLFSLSPSNEVEMADLDVKPDDVDLSLHFTGYRRDLFGSFALASVSLSSFIWIALLSICVADYYGAFAGLDFRDNEMLFVNHDNLSTIFVILWHLSVVWFVSIKIASSRALTFFSVRCPLARATTVVIKRKREEPIRLSNSGRVVEFVQIIENSFRRLTRTDYTVSVVEVEQTSGGRRFIPYECVRYVFDEKSRTFEPTRFLLGPTCADLHKQGGGLASREAFFREELIGNNEIAFPADTFASMLLKEFSGFFYIYQMMTLFVWYYYGYYYMGIVLTIVIVCAGLLKVTVALRSQRKVLEMASFEGSVRVCRDGMWRDFSTRDLVPGDVIEVQATEHVLPVDCVLVDGGAVADESSLTGEALPVAKFPLRDEATRFHRDDTFKANCLYAGCHVLQTQPSAPDTPVRAVVTATGASTSKGRLVRDILYPTAVSFVFSEHLKVRTGMDEEKGENPFFAVSLPDPFRGFVGGDGV